MRSAAGLAGGLAGDVSVTTDPMEVIHNPFVDAVLVCSSTDTHAALVMDAARAGKHVFCEKPLDLTIERIDEVLRVVESSKVKLQVGFNRRFDPDFARVRDLVSSGAVGAVHLLRIASRDPSPPPIEYVRVSGGMFMDMTAHDFDMARFVLGAEVEEVFARAAVLVDPAIGEAGDVDTAAITLSFSNGAIGVIDNSRKAAYGYDQRIEVFGSLGMASNSNRQDLQVDLTDSAGVHGPLPQHFFMQRYLASYEAEIRAFIEAIVKDTTPPVTGLDARKATLIALAARQSVLTNRPVRVDR